MSRTFPRAAVAALAGALLTTSGIAGTAATAAAHPKASATPTAHATHRVPSDFDGDGVPDLAVGAPGHDFVQVSYSKAQGGALVLLSAHTAHVGTMAFGAVLAAGDFNHDGYADLAVGAPQFETTKFDEQGAVFVFAGSKTGLHRVDVIQHDYPSSDDGTHEFGGALATRDVDHDGYFDLAISQPLNQHRFVDLYRGSATGLRTGHPQMLHVSGGYALTFGDVNGDKHPDLIVGRPYVGNSDIAANGALAVFMGSSSGIGSSFTSISAHAIGAREGGSLGYAVDAGDINGDGYADVVAGAPNRNEIAVLFGSKHGLHPSNSQLITQHKLFSGQTRMLDGFGSALAVGDVTGDGRDDVAIGSSGVWVGHIKYAGRVFFLRGSKHGVTLAHRQTISQNSNGVPGDARAFALFGAALYLAPLSGSKHLDLVIGASNDSELAHDAGLVVGLRGSADGLSDTHAFAQTDETPGAQFGSAIV